MSEKNCAFQYAKITGDFMPRTEIVCDKNELTIEDAKQLWNQYHPDAAKHIKNGGRVEMVIWINMSTSSSYGESLEHISYDAESDGVSIWETKKQYFTKHI